MIPLSEINEFSKKYDVSAETIEKDYVIAWMLIALTQSEIKNNFIFYGGTAIKRVFFDAHRFSEDIDLISTGNYSLTELLNHLHCLKVVRDASNIELNINHERIISRKTRHIIFVEYRCHDEIVGAPKEIQIDLNMKADFIGDHLEKNIVQTYSDEYVSDFV
jgi:predicted nucleotidyltransferase component of viral defense system